MLRLRPVQLYLSARSSRSSVSSASSEEVRGVPAEISVETHWLREMRVAAAASLRAVMMEGPGKMCAFTSGAQVAMR